MATTLIPVDMKYSVIRARIRTFFTISKAQMEHKMIVMVKIF